MLLRRKDGRPEPVTVFDGPFVVWGRRVPEVGRRKPNARAAVRRARQQTQRWSIDLTGADRASVAKVVGNVCAKI